MKRFNLHKWIWRSQTRRFPSGSVTPPQTTISTIITSMNFQKKTLCRVLSRTFHRGGPPSSAKKTTAPIPLTRGDQCQNRSFPNFYNIFARTLKCSIKPIRVLNNNLKMIWKLIKIMTISRRMRYGHSRCRDINKVCQRKPRALLSRRRARMESLICTNSFRTLSTCHWTALLSRCL